MRYLAPALMVFAGYAAGLPVLSIAGIVIAGVLVAAERPPVRQIRPETPRSRRRWGVGAGIGIGPFVVGLYRRIGR